MLRVCRKGEVEGGQVLSAEEDRALRLAFGRFAKPFRGRPHYRISALSWSPAGPSCWLR